MEQIIGLIKKYKEFLLYGIFGVLTTVVNIVVYAACTRIFSMGTVAATVIAWILSVAFAYITNRIWVFESKASSGREILREVSAFVSCRLLTGFLDLVIMYVFVDMMAVQADVLVKIASNVLVIILNYVASKLVIFKK